MISPELSEIPVEDIVELCSKNYYTLDGLWFVAVEEKYGLEAALELDIKVWRRGGATLARRLVDTLGIAGSPIETIVKALVADPFMYVYKPVTSVSNGNKALLRCTDCPPQKARIRDGRGEFPCRGVGLALFEAFAQAIDPRAKVCCLRCPPDTHPPEFWCEWEFEV